MLAEIQTLATVVLVVVTSFYVVLTKGILDASIKAWKDAKMPILILETWDARELSTDLARESDRIVNIGVGPAVDVEVLSDARFDGVRVVERGQPLENWPFQYDKVIRVSDRGVKFFSNVGARILDDKDIQFAVRYKDVFGREFRTWCKAKENVFERVGRR